MQDNVIVKVDGLYKKFCKDLRASMLSGMIDFYRSFLGVKRKGVRFNQYDFWSLRNINFSLQEGDFLIVLGVNGAGKSTLLRMIEGILLPDQGKIYIKGKSILLAVLGLGFHLKMSGRENIYLNGSIIGMSRQEINRSFDSIVDFSGIEEFLDYPLGSYSSGMNMRLGISIALHSNFDILLLDEIFAVGDTNFRNKVLFRIAEMRKSHQIKGVILVNHNLKYSIHLCNKILVLDRGELVFFGKKEEGLLVYQDMVQNKVLKDRQRHLKDKNIVLKGYSTLRNIYGDQVDFLEHCNHPLVYEFVAYSDQFEDIEFILKRDPDFIFYRKKIPYKLFKGQKLVLKISQFNFGIGIYAAMIRSSEKVLMGSEVWFRIKSSNCSSLSLFKARIAFSIKKLEDYPIVQ